MTKKKIFLCIFSVVILCISVGAVLFLKQLGSKPQYTLQKTVSVSPSPTPSQELLIWDDPAGFSFKYPKGVTINNHDEDQINYAHIEITNPVYKGRIIVWAKDTVATTIADWLKKEPSLKDAVSIDTTFGGNEAKKVMVKVPTSKQITATLDEDILVMVETELDDAYWQQVNDGIVESFTFGVSKKDDGVGGASTATEEPQAAADEEESIE
jgi:hypothetical protein